MFYKLSAKSLLAMRNSILLNAIPSLEEQGFEKSPFTSSWYGRNNLGDFTYHLARLSNSCLELITIHICRGDRWIQVYLNIFELNPVPKTLSELKRVKGIVFHLPPDNLTKMRLDLELPRRSFFGRVFRKKAYRLKSFYTQAGLVKQQHKLENLLKHDFKNIDLKIELWHKVHKPIKTDWEGNPIS